MLLGLIDTIVECKYRNISDNIDLSIRLIDTIVECKYPMDGDKFWDSFRLIDTIVECKSYNRLYMVPLHC